MKKQKIQMFGDFLRPYAMRELVVLVLMLTGTLLSLASPYFLKIIIDQVIPEKDLNQLVLILFALLILYVIRLGVDFCCDYLTTWISNRVINDIKIRMFSSLTRMPYTYFEENKPGDIIQKSSAEVQKIQGFLTSSVIRLLNNLFLLIGLTGMLCVLNLRLFVLSVLVVPASIAVNRLLNRKIKHQIELAGKEEGNVFSFYYDRIRNFKLIKDYNAGERELANLEGKWSQLFALYVKTACYSSLARNTSTLLVVTGPLLILGYGGYQAIHGLITVGSIVAFIQYMNRFYAPVNDMIFLYADYVKAKVSMNRVLPLLFPDTKEDSGFIQAVPGSIEKVTVDNISLCLGGRAILDNLSLELKRGRRYGIVGMSGSGKTTLLKVLCKVYHPSSGRVLVNGHCPLDSVSEKWWREHVTIVNQEPLFLRESVLYNISYGRPDITEGEILQVLEQLELTEFINQLPDRLNTVVGEGEDGILLSGGQLQIIGLVRAFIKKADLIILDESTCSLDSIQEKRLLKKVFSRFREKILIVVSHRLSSLTDLDEVLVLQQGKIIQQGSPEGLVDNGHFHQMFQAQLEVSFPVSDIKRN
jgi:ABC-type bacteriocin/lantibiotic exporter with double-glycine peptidase domain